jgi:hypothetical protein
MRRMLVPVLSITTAAVMSCIALGLNVAMESSEPQSAEIQRTKSISADVQTNTPVGIERPEFFTIENLALGPGPENVLYYEDFALGQSAYMGAINQLGWSYLFTNDPNVFAAQLGTSGYTHVIAAHQNAFGAQAWETPLLSWISNNPGKTVLISDWRTSDAAGYLGALGFAHGAVNPGVLVPKPGPCFDGLSAVDIVNTGWSIYSYETLGGIAIANTEAGTPMIARNGNIFFNGFLSDVIGDPNIAIEYVVRELLKCAPDPCDNCLGDLNGDGAVDGGDLLLLLANWGPCPQPGCTNGFVCTPPFENYPCGDPGDDCVCLFNFAGGISCGRHAGCTMTCVTGVCPDGMICAVDTCCGQPVCLPACPSAAADAGESTPLRPGEPTSARPADFVEPSTEVFSSEGS